MKALLTRTLISVALLTSACGGGDEPAPAAPSTSLAPAGPAPAPGQGRSEIGGTTVPCAPPPSIPREQATGLLPAGVSLPEEATLLAVSDAAGVSSVTAESRAGISSLQELFRSQLLAAGSAIHREDNEGHEAELYFTTPTGEVGSVQQRRVACPPGTTRFAITVVRTAGG